MAQYISKDALIAEINRRKQTWQHQDQQYVNGGRDVCDYLLGFLDTLEVKEVDLEKSARHYLLQEHLSPLNNILHQADLKTEMQYHKDIESAFKAGYEFCLKIQKGE